MCGNAKQVRLHGSWSAAVSVAESKQPQGAFADSRQQQQGTGIIRQHFAPSLSPCPLSTADSKQQRYQQSITHPLHMQVAKELYEAGATCCVQQDYLAGRVIKAQLVAERKYAAAEQEVSAAHAGRDQAAAGQPAGGCGETRVMRTPSGLHNRRAAFADRADDHKDELDEEERDAVVKILARFY